MSVCQKLGHIHSPPRCRLLLPLLLQLDSGSKSPGVGVSSHGVLFGCANRGPRRLVGRHQTAEHGLEPSSPGSARAAGKLGWEPVASGSTGAVQSGGADELCDEAAELLHLLVQRGSYVPPSLLYLGVLKRFVRTKNVVLGDAVHALVVGSGYEANRFLGNHIIRMYASQGRLQEALQVFTGLFDPNAHSWSCIILAHAERGQPRQAIGLYCQMRELTVLPDNHVFVAVLKACASAGDLASGRQVHADVLMRCSVVPNVFVGSCLVDMYAKCGSLGDARGVFDTLATRDVVAWNAMLAGYAQQGHGQETLDLYASMQHEGIPADQITYVCLLKACASTSALQQGKQLHWRLRECGLESVLAIGNCLVDMYAKCGSLDDARRVFDNMPMRDVVTWTAMLAGYAHHGLGQEALTLYSLMQQEGLSVADQVTFVCLLKACASIAALHEGKRVHCQIRERGLDSDLVIGNCLVDMYSKCGSLGDARRVFDNLCTRDVVTWNVMLAGYVQHGHGLEALALYASMPQEGITFADGFTFVSLLKACASTAALNQGKELHLQIRQRGLESDLVIGSCLVDMYAKCGSLIDARRFFDSVASKDAVMWNAMLAGYAQHGLGQEALVLYSSMQQEGITPSDHVTFVCLLKACASIAALRHGKELHARIRERGLETDIVIGNCLVDMYAKCGSLDDARRLFDSLVTKDVVTWNTMIAVYAQHGCWQQALECYKKMQLAGLNPTRVTFLSLISACSHAGQVDTGIDLFQSMSRDYGLTPEVEHYVSVVDLLGRAGCFTRLEQFLSTIPMEPNLAIWLTVLAACRKHGNVVLAERVFGHALYLQPKHAAAYAMMAHIYFDAGLPDAAREVGKLRDKQCVLKEPGRSWIELEEEAHSFLVGDGKHPQNRELYEVLEKVSLELKKAGHP